MVKVPSSKRILKYEVKRKVSMPRAYESMITNEKLDLTPLGERAKIDEAVSGILNRHGIPGNDRIKYHNFARRIERLKRTGVLVPASLEAEMAKYERLGCERTILEEIVKSITGAEA